MRKKGQPTVIIMKDGIILKKNDRKQIIEGMDHYFVINWIPVAY